MTVGGDYCMCGRIYGYGEVRADDIKIFTAVNNFVKFFVV